MTIIHSYHSPQFKYMIFHIFFATLSWHSFNHKYVLHVIKHGTIQNVILSCANPQCIYGRNPKIALTWPLEGTRRRGLTETWRKTVNKEIENRGFKTWREANVAAKDRVAWRRKSDGYWWSHSSRGKKGKMMMTFGFYNIWTCKILSQNRILCKS